VNYSQIMSPIPLCLEKWGGGHDPPAPMGAPPLTTASGVCMLQERVYRSWIHDVSWKNVESWKNDCWGSGGCWTMHTVIAAAIAQWHSRLNAWVRVNGGHFEHKFWASDFLLCLVCFVDTGCPKCDRYKYVQSANIVWNVLLLCLKLSYGMVAT